MRCPILSTLAKILSHIFLFPFDLSVRSPKMAIYLCRKYLTREDTGLDSEEYKVAMELAFP